MATKNIDPYSSPRNWVLVGGSLVTLFIWTNLLDPFNAPKSWILYITGMYLLGWVGFQIRASLQNPVLKATSLLSGGFLLALFCAFIFTDEKYVGLFGETARRTGFLTYLSLTIFFCCAAMTFRLSHTKRVDKVALIVGSILGLYGFMQHFNLDFIKWNNPYNSVLSTLGNPDFASAAMAIFFVLLCGICVNKKNLNWVRLYAVGAAIMLFITILFSQARQGLLASMMGTAVILFVFLNQRHKVLAIGFASFSLLGILLGIAGMLNKGPLATYLYKASVTFRGDYWRAGLNMFKHHPIFGVGLDRFGAYFRQYRDATQSLRRGPEITANAAHNVPIQLAATGGVFLVLFFLALSTFIFWRGIVAVRRTSGVEQLIIASVFGAWITYEAQSFISIDNVGIAVWGWILGGVIVGISIPETSPTTALTSLRKKPKNYSRSNPLENIPQKLTSGLGALAMFAMVLPLFLVETTAHTASSFAKPTSTQINAYVAAVEKPLNYGLVDPHVRVLTATLIAEAGQVDRGLKILKEVVRQDPRNYEALGVISAIYEQTKNVSKAIPYRKQMTVLDPYNQKILLKLGEDLKAIGDSEGAKAIIPIINSFASSTSEAAQAQKEFGA